MVRWEQESCTHINHPAVLCSESLQERLNWAGGGGVGGLGEERQDVDGAEVDLVDGVVEDEQRLVHSECVDDVHGVALVLCQLLIESERVFRTLAFLALICQ